MLGELQVKSEQKQWSEDVREPVQQQTCDAGADYDPYMITLTDCN